MRGVVPLLLVLAAAGCLQWPVEAEFWVLEVSSDVREEPAPTRGDVLCGLYLFGPHAGLNHSSRTLVLPAGKHDVRSSTWVVVLHHSVEVVDDTNCDRDWRMYGSEGDFDWGWRGATYRVEQAHSGAIRLDGELLFDGVPVVRAIDLWEADASRRIVGNLTFVAHGPWSRIDEVVVPPRRGHYSEDIGRRTDSGGDWVVGMP